ncbi:hypothetical protein GCM10007886_47040 [Methylobacterium gregans]|nr:hypothetical protein GCM10007886_47040 [Methylobacterium gregans]
MAGRQGSIRSRMDLPGTAPAAQVTLTIRVFKRQHGGDPVPALDPETLSGAGDRKLAYRKLSGATWGRVR